MLFRRTRVPVFLAAVTATLALSGAGCIFSPDEKDPEGPPPLTLLPATPPENLLKNLQTIYNDKEHSAIERLNAYESLFFEGSTDPPQQGFIFRFQPADIANGLPESWGLDDELRAHEGLFNAQDNGEIYLLELRITYGATEPIENDPTRVDWEEIFASNVYLRLMFNPNDGLEVNGGQAEFQFAPDPAKPPADGARFYGGYWIADWRDLPRP